VTGSPASLVVGCTAGRTLVAVVDDPAPVSLRLQATLALNGSVLSTIDLLPGTAPPDVVLEPGTVWTAPFAVDLVEPGTFEVTVTAQDGDATATLDAKALDVATNALPVIGPVTLAPATIAAGGTSNVLVSARVSDDCGISQVSVQADANSDGQSDSSVNIGRSGRKRDVLTDRVFSRKVRFREPTPGTTVDVWVEAVNVPGERAASDPVPLQVAP